MAYTLPTAVDLKARHTAFADVDDAVVADALAEAATMVGESWFTERAYRTGAMLYACHQLTLWGFGGGMEAQIAAKGALTLRSVSDGAVSVTRSGSAEGGSLDLSGYGQQFRDLRRASVFPGTVGVPDA